MVELLKWNKNVTGGKPVDVGDRLSHKAAQKLLNGISCGFVVKSSRTVKVGGKKVRVIEDMEIVSWWF